MHVRINTIPRETLDWNLGEFIVGYNYHLAREGFAYPVDMAARHSAAVFILSRLRFRVYSYAQCKRLLRFLPSVYGVLHDLHCHLLLRDPSHPIFLHTVSNLETEIRISIGGQAL